MISLWFEHNWYIVPILGVLLIVACISIRQLSRYEKSKEWMNPMDKALYALGAILGGIFTLVGIMGCAYSLWIAHNEYGKPYTMVVDIHYTPNHSVRKVFVSTNMAFKVEKGRGYTKIYGADGYYLWENNPVEIISNTYKEIEQ